MGIVVKDRESGQGKWGWWLVELGGSQDKEVGLVREIISTMKISVIKTRPVSGTFWELRRPRSG